MMNFTSACDTYRYRGNRIRPAYAGRKPIDIPLPRARPLTKGGRFVMDIPGTFVRLGRTFNCRLRKDESSRAIAASTASRVSNSIYANPLGCPVNLLHNIVTRFIGPQPRKCASSSSAVEP